METEKQKLLKEKNTLLMELKNLGIHDSMIDDWMAIPYKLADEDASDTNDTADRFEDFGEKSALVEELEARYRTVLEKLSKLE